MATNDILPILTIVISAIAIAYVTWKSKSGTLWKDTAEAYEKRLKQVEADSKCQLNELAEKVSVLEVKVDLYQKELEASKKKIAVLEKVQPSIVFEQTVESILNELKILAQSQKDLRFDFVKHANDDDKRFNNIGEFAEANNKILNELIKKEG